MATNYPKFSMWLEANAKLVTGTDDEAEIQNVINMFKRMLQRDGKITDRIKLAYKEIQERKPHLLSHVQRTIKDWMDAQPQQPAADEIAPTKRYSREEAERQRLAANEKLAQEAEARRQREKEAAQAERQGQVDKDRAILDWLKKMALTTQMTPEQIVGRRQFYDLLDAAGKQGQTRENAMRAAIQKIRDFRSEAKLNSGPAASPPAEQSGDDSSGGGGFLSWLRGKNR